MPETAPVDPSAEVREIALHYAEEAGMQVARRFVLGFREAVDHIRTNPASGSPRFRDATGIADLRVWPIRGFPYLVFYRDAEGGALILRVLHSARDIAPTLRKG